MDHGSPERGDLLKRGLHVRNGEIGQRSGVAGSISTSLSKAKDGAATELGMGATLTAVGGKGVGAEKPTGATG